MAQKPILLDGVTGEGGGQLVRLAVCLSALTSQPVKLINIRGNRTTLKKGDSKGGGLKSQHVTAIECLAKATRAEIEGLSVGSHTLTFHPTTKATDLATRKLQIAADQEAASTMLILQAILPFLLFAGNEKNEAIEVEIAGGTNVSFSLSYDYLDQILLPTLQERFGLRVERKVLRRGWSSGPKTPGGGLVWLKVHPLQRGQKLRFIEPAWHHGSSEAERYEVAMVDVTIIVPQSAHEMLQRELVKDLGAVFASADVHFHTIQDSGHESRWYVLLVARSTSGIRWGRDSLIGPGKRVKSKPQQFASALSQSLCRDLSREVSLEGEVDEHLHDQLVVFQALADGFSSFEKERRGDGTVDADISTSLRQMKDWDERQRLIQRMKINEPAGNGTLHTRTVRWVASEFLPQVKFYRNGDVVDGASISFD